MTTSLYRSYRAWRRDIVTGKVATASRPRASQPIIAAIARLGIGLAGISCGGDLRAGRPY